MIVNVSISTARVLEECITQTSIDLQSMRSRGIDLADAVYEDWVMNRNNAVELYSQLQHYGANLYKILRTFVVSFSPGRDIIVFNIVVNHPKFDIEHVIDNFALSFFKFCTLEWWYRYKDIELSNQYATKASEAADNIFTLCLPRSGTIIPRYY